jgi:hypothetical protein
MLEVKETVVVEAEAYKKLVSLNEAHGKLLDAYHELSVAKDRANDALEAGKKEIEKLKADLRLQRESGLRAVGESAGLVRALETVLSYHS